jgi:hypothetical protein
MNDPHHETSAPHDSQPRLRAFALTTLFRIVRDGFGRCAAVQYLCMSGWWLYQYGFLVLALAGDASREMDAAVGPSHSCERRSFESAAPSH